MDSILLICSALGLFHTPKYVGRGVNANEMEAILPKEDRKSMTFYLYPVGNS